MRADLHVHTTASDGTLTPTQVVELAQERHVDVLAVADHDSVEGLGQAAQAARAAGITLVPAVELSAVADGIDVHVLAYFVDPGDPLLLDRLSELRASRGRRAEAMVAALADAGYPVTIQDVLALSDGGAVGRSHVARALVASGAAQSISDAFRRLIGRGRPYYVAKDSRSPREVVGIVRDLRAIPVLAHPGVTHADPLIDELVAAGILGIEAYHADHSPADRERYAALAARLGLLVTGGTDYHGPDAPNPELGSVDVPEQAVLALLAAGERL